MIKIDAPMIIAIGTHNRAKTQGVEDAFGKVFSDFTIHSFDVESGVANQPTTEEESIAGATNRAKSALSKLPSADYGVGLEGGVVTIAGEMFLHGWAAVVNKDGVVGLGHSSGLELPNSLKKAIDGGAELGPLMQELLQDDDNDVRHGLGTIGILTGGLETRVDEFTSATTMALAKFITPEFYR